MTNVQRELQDAYLDYVNDFLTVEGYASHYEMTVAEARAIIDAGCIVHHASLA